MGPMLSNGQRNTPRGDMTAHQLNIRNKSNFKAFLLRHSVTGASAAVLVSENHSPSRRSTDYMRTAFTKVSFLIKSYADLVFRNLK